MDSLVEGKGKVVPVFFKLNTTPWRHVREWRYSYTHSSISALDGGEWSASRPGRFTARERAPGTHRIGGWVGSRAVLDAAVNIKIPSPRRESNSKTPNVQPVAQRYTDWAITVRSLVETSAKLQLTVIYAKKKNIPRNFL
jgi:hypothetical protein